jgi:hypothetical protein
MNRFLLTILFCTALFVPNILLGQDVDMADNFRKEGKIYVVVIVTSIVFLGIVIYLISLDRKTEKVGERKQK